MQWDAKFAAECVSGAKRNGCEHRRGVLDALQGVMNCSIPTAYEYDFNALLNSPANLVRSAAAMYGWGNLHSEAMRAKSRRDLRHDSDSLAVPHSR